MSAGGRIAVSAAAALACMAYVAILMFASVWAIAVCSAAAASAFVGIITYRALGD